MDAMTLLELTDVNDRQGLSGPGGMACCSQEEASAMSGLAGYFSDAADCLWSPIKCAKAAFGSEEVSAQAWREVKQPDAPAPRPQARPTQPFVGPVCPPQLRETCQPPGKFDPYNCLCEVSQSVPGVPASCQPPNVFDPVNKVCYRNSESQAGQPWYKQTPILVALGLGVVALALSMRAKP